MGHSWALQDAKNKLSELVDRASEEGPQTITRHGREVAVVISPAQFRKLAAPMATGDLVSFFANSPLAGLEIELARDHDVGRKIPL